ncbi:hypothetical protein [Mycobacterium genavense]|uniref:hypothetical protein n=1 Tax=Mycobacterium genavense TaxID=36812 RepID=UPI00047286AE|nr:hypothetical protein [Mycobacterium genavense]
MDTTEHVIERWPFGAVVERIHCDLVLSAKVFRKFTAWVKRLRGRETSIGYWMIAAESLRYLEDTGEDVADGFAVSEQGRDRSIPE